MKPKNYSFVIDMLIQSSKHSSTSSKYSSTSSKYSVKTKCPSYDLYINDLPDEVLVRVFSFFRPVQDDLPGLAMVCRKWRRILQTTGQLWRELYVNPSVYEYYHFSMVCCIFRVYGVHVQRLTWYKNSPVYESMFALIPKLYNLRYLRLPILWTRAVVESLQNLSQLEHIQINGGFALTDEDLELISESFPKLKEVSLNACWRVTAAGVDEFLSSLEHLETFKLKVNSGLPLHDVRSEQAMREGGYIAHTVSETLHSHRLSVMCLHFVPIEMDELWTVVKRLTSLKKLSISNCERALDDTEDLTVLKELDAEPTMDELSKAIDALNSGKSPELSDAMHGVTLELSDAMHGVTLELSDAMHGVTLELSDAMHGVTLELSDAMHGVTLELSDAMHGVTLELSDAMHGVTLELSDAMHGVTLELSDAMHGVTLELSDAMHGVTLELSDAMHGVTLELSDAMHGVTLELSDDAMHGVTLELSDAMHGVTLELSDAMHGVTLELSDAMHGVTLELSDAMHGVTLELSDAMHGVTLELSDAMHGVTLELSDAMHGVTIELSDVMHGVTLELSDVMHGVTLELSDAMHGVTLELSDVMHGVTLELSDVMHRVPL
ncbi:hypothetical protein Btru_053337 [Bulinus truncatus]|nr:hypothetical protein Btru_053337 [Bulinus truncatus]